MRRDSRAKKGAPVGADLTRLIPNVYFQTMVDGRPTQMSTYELFNGKSVVLFGLPGAYTPTCHYYHLPSINDEVPAMKGDGVDTVAITTVNDIYVLKAWADDLEVSPEILLLADGNADFARSMGLSFHARELGLGERTRRYSMWVKNGSIQVLNIEPDFTLADVTSAHSISCLLKTFQMSHF